MRKLLLPCLLLLTLISCGKEEAPSAPPPQEVPVAQVVKKDVPISMEFVGQTVGSIDAEIRARVDGVITGIHFEEGKPVQEGQLLYTIDPAPFEAKIAEAKGNLAEAETKLAKAESDLKRIRPLAQMKAVSEKDLDAAVAQEGSARGSVDAAKAALESANIELSYTKISSPTLGTIGMTKAKLGEYVGKPPNPTILNTVSKLDPIHVRLSITEKEYLYFAHKKEERIAAGQQNEKRVLQLFLADGALYPHTGEVVVVDRQINAQTGTLTVEAAFPNPNEIVRPGQFAKVKTVSETLKGVLVVPKRAVRELQGQYQVFVVQSDNAVALKNIELGPEVGDLQVVNNGLAENDRVVVEGMGRLKSGVVVSPKLLEPTESKA